MDDARIRQLTEEVLARIGGAPAASSPPALEARVAALEAAVARLQPAAPPRPAPGEPPVHVHVHAHPSLQALRAGPASSERCVVEPDKPCVQSGQCRALGP
jgi:hypothetical protein